MSNRTETTSDLVEIAKRNGDFSKNYGKILGALLYLRSISAARRRSVLSSGAIFAAFAAAAAWLQKHCLTIVQ